MDSHLTPPDLTPEERRAAKRALRRAALAARDAVEDRPRREAAIGAAVADLIARHFAGAAVAAYSPMRGEVDPMPGLRGHRGPLALPVVVAPRSPLVFREWQLGEDLDAGSFGTRHPTPLARELHPRLVLLPLAGFDRLGNRLGYGGGFYDRTIESLRRRGPVAAVGLAFQAQEVGPIPVEPTDQPLDGIVTEQGLRRFDR